MKPGRASPDKVDLFLFILALVGLLLGAAVPMGLASAALGDFLGGQQTERSITLWGAVAFGSLGLPGVPSLYWSGRAILGEPAPAEGRPANAWSLLLLAFPFGVLVGYAAFELKTLPAILALPFQVLALGLPVLLAVLLVRHRGPAVSPRRAWGQFLSGSWLVPPFAFFLEALSLIPTLLLIGIGVSLSPQAEVLLEQLTQRPPPWNPEEFLELLGDVIFQPWFLVIILTYMAGVVPLIEEALKSIAVWPLLGRRLSSAEAFQGGVLGGAGYALFESLFSGQTGDFWTVTILGRAGASIMHAFTAGIVSWGLVEAVNQRRWKILGAAYLSSVAMHGLWNATALAFGLGTVSTEMSQAWLEPGLNEAVTLLSPLVLVALMLIALTGLIVFTARLAPRADEESANRAE